MTEERYWEDVGVMGGSGVSIEGMLWDFDPD